MALLRPGDPETDPLVLVMDRDIASRARGAPAQRLVRAFEGPAALAVAGIAILVAVFHPFRHAAVHVVEIGPGARRILPFGTGQEAIGLARPAREPGSVLLRVLPAYVGDRIARARPECPVRPPAAAAIGHARIPFGVADLEARDRQDVAHLEASARTARHAAVCGEEVASRQPHHLGTVEAVAKHLERRRRARALR